LDPSGSGFNDPNLGTARKARLADVLEYISSILNVTGTLDVQVDVSENNASTSLLAFAGTYFQQASGFHDGSSTYRLKTGTKLFARYPEIEITVNFGYNWDLSNTAPTSEQVDFFSILLHEMTHGLGFVSLIAADGTSTSKIPPDDAHSYTTFDSLIGKASNAPLLGGDPTTLQGSTSELINPLGLYFLGAHARTLYGQSVYPPLYVPNPFVSRSSLMHWNYGVDDAVMLPSLGYGVMRRAYTPVDLGALIDLGYTNAAFPNEGEGETEGEGEIPPCPITAVTITQPSGDVSAPDANPVAVSLNCTVALGTSNCTASTVTVTYSINDSEIGQSSDRTNHFPVQTQLAAGSYTLAAHAEVDGGNSMESTRSFSVVTPEAAHLEVSPDPTGPLDFGVVDIGTTAQQVFTLTNTGGATLIGTASVTGDAFAISGTDTYTLAKNQSVEIYVAFTPTAKGVATSSLNFSSNVSSTVTVQLRGTGAKTDSLGCAADTRRGGMPAWTDLLIMALTALALAAGSRSLYRTR
jgi:hypothetical protein